MALCDCGTGHAIPPPRATPGTRVVAGLSLVAAASGVHRPAWRAFSMRWWIIAPVPSRVNSPSKRTVLPTR